MTRLKTFLSTLANKSKAHTSDHGGFTLIEVVVAMNILSIGILAVMQMGLVANRNITSGNIVTQAVLHAQSEIEKIRAHESLADLIETFPEDPLQHVFMKCPTGSPHPWLIHSISRHHLIAKHPTMTAAAPAWPR